MEVCGGSWWLCGSADCISGPHRALSSLQCMATPWYALESPTTQPPTHPPTYHIPTQPPSTSFSSHPMAWCPLILSPQVDQPIPYSTVNNPLPNDNPTNLSNSSPLTHNDFRLGSIWSNHWPTQDNAKVIWKYVDRIYMEFLRWWGSFVPADSAISNCQSHISLHGRDTTKCLWGVSSKVKNNCKGLI